MKVQSIHENLKPHSSYSEIYLFWCAVIVVYDGDWAPKVIQLFCQYTITNEVKKLSYHFSTPCRIG